MKSDVLSNTLTHNELGRIIYRRPQVFVFVYPDGGKKSIRNVMVFAYMKTGCYVLITAKGLTYSVPTGYRYCVSGPMESK